jgi:hypothetical protein
MTAQRLLEMDEAAFSAALETVEGMALLGA